MLRITAKLEQADVLLEKIRLLKEGAGENFDKPIDSAAWKLRTFMVTETPKGWTGNTRQQWSVSKPGPGQRIVFNPSKVMLWLDQGTGLTTGGWIFPKEKLCLFIPLTSSAAIGGWNSGLKYGEDYILAKKVRGIKAMHLVDKGTTEGQRILVGEMKAFLQRVLNN